MTKNDQLAREDDDAEAGQTPTVSDVPACPNCWTNEHVVEEPETGYWHCRECGFPQEGADVE